MSNTSIFVAGNWSGFEDVLRGLNADVYVQTFPPPTGSPCISVSADMAYARIGGEGKVSNFAPYYFPLLFRLLNSRNRGASPVACPSLL